MHFKSYGESWPYHELLLVIVLGFFFFVKFVAIISFYISIHFIMSRRMDLNKLVQ